VLGVLSFGRAFPEDTELSLDEVAAGWGEAPLFSLKVDHSQHYLAAFF
jgi:hypothetical protein